MWKMFNFVNIPFYFVFLSWIPFGLKFCSLHVCLLIHCHSDSDHSIVGRDLQFNFKIFVSSRLSGYNLNKNVEDIQLWKHQLSPVIILWIPSVVWYLYYLQLVCTHELLFKLNILCTFFSPSCYSYFDVLLLCFPLFILISFDTSWSRYLLFI